LIRKTVGFYRDKKKRIRPITRGCGKRGFKIRQKTLVEYGFPKVKTKMRLGSKKELISNLSRKPVLNVWYTNDRIALLYDGERLSNTIKIQCSEPWVGSWDKSGRPVIYIDNNVPEKYRESLAIHETVEKYVAEKYHLDPNVEAHEVAEAVEKRWFVKKYGRKEWDEYSKVVERIHRKELSKIGV